MPTIFIEHLIHSFSSCCNIASMKMLSCVVFVTTPLILIAYQEFHQVYPIKYILLVPGNYPWTIAPNGFLYRLHYLVESASSIFAIVVSGGIDALFTLYIFQIIGQFRAMSYRITHTRAKHEYFCVLRECIKQHEIIMRCRDILEKIYGPIILWTMLVNALNLCSQMFDFTQMTNVSIQRAVFFAIYMMFKLVQTFAYAWAGLRLTEEVTSNLITIFVTVNDAV
uniref:Olfactory receptor 94 n=1 Tax=Aulacocentrum confusum TaxID=2767324 RepID=A0A7G8Z9B3_9HYME|nr:olfactory receptor 94 [Aulacocentrum confusum]